MVLISLYERSEEVIVVNNGTDFCCECDNCGGEFIVVYERSVDCISEEDIENA